MASDGWACRIVRALICSDLIQQFYIMMQYLTHKSKEPQVGVKAPSTQREGTGDLT